jgi:hypothetical protein
LLEIIDIVRTDCVFPIRSFKQLLCRYDHVLAPIKIYIEAVAQASRDAPSGVPSTGLRTA